MLLVNNEEPDQRAHCVVSGLGLHCLPMTLLRSPGTCKDGLMGIFLLFSGRLVGGGCLVLGSLL